MDGKNIYTKMFEDVGDGECQKPEKQGVILAYNSNTPVLFVTCRMQNSVHVGVSQIAPEPPNIAYHALQPL